MDDLSLPEYLQSFLLVYSLFDFIFTMYREFTSQIWVKPYIVHAIYRFVAQSTQKDIMALWKTIWFIGIGINLFRKSKCSAILQNYYKLMYIYFLNLSNTLRHLYEI